jgi:hypothetical protein
VSSRQLYRGKGARLWRVVLVGLSVICGACSADAAERKGVSRGTGWALGLLLGIIGRIIVGVMRESRTVQSNWAGAVGTDAADAPRVQHR